MEAVLHWVSTYGYFAIFSLLVLGIVGLPVPDEWLIVFSGYLAYSGRLHPVPTILSAIWGSTCGITLSYLIGRKIGLPLIHSKLGRFTRISDEQIQRVHDWFDRAGHWTLFFGYYFPGVRHFTAIVAGGACLEFATFALFAYCGAIVWVLTFFFVGYHFGEHWKAALAFVETNMRFVTVIAIASVLGYLWLIFRRARK